MLAGSSPQVASPLVRWSPFSCTRSPYPEVYMWADFTTLTTNIAVIVILLLTIICFCSRRFCIVLETQCPLWRSSRQCLAILTEGQSVRRRETWLLRSWREEYFSKTSPSPTRRLLQIRKPWKYLSEKVNVELIRAWVIASLMCSLQSVSMEIAAGKLTALVGPSGSGKTSCLSLLKRLYEPQEGEILLDGKPLHHYTRKYLHQKVLLEVPLNQH